MDDLARTTLASLERAICRDCDKGGVGMRSTSEVASTVGMSTSKTRVLLDHLAAEGLVDCYDASREGSSRPSYEWRVAGYDWDEYRGLHRVDGKAALSWGDLAAA